MMRRIFILVLTGTLLGVLAGPAASAGRGSVFAKDRYNDPYTFQMHDCGFRVKVKGHRRGHSVTYNVEGSDGQAFLFDDHYNWTEVLTNPRNGKRMYLSGHGHFTEKKATHVEGDIWEFIQVDRGRPFVVKDGRGHTVLADHGKAIFKQTLDTLGDSEPGGDEVDFEVLRTVRGDFPSLAPGFDFCRMVTRLIG